MEDLKPIPAFYPKDNPGRRQAENPSIIDRDICKALGKKYDPHHFAYNWYIVIGGGLQDNKDLHDASLQYYVEKIADSRHLKPLLEILAFLRERYVSRLIKSTS